MLPADPMVWTDIRKKGEERVGGQLQVTVRSAVLLDGLELVGFKDGDSSGGFIRLQY